MEPEVQNTEVKEPHPVFKVTPLSKYLAMVLFILMPFVGGYVGYVYAPEKVVEVERLVYKGEIDSTVTDNDPLMMFSPDKKYVARVAEEGSILEIAEVASNKMIYTETAIEAGKTSNEWSTFTSNQCVNSSELNWIGDSTLQIKVFDGYPFDTGLCEAKFIRDHVIQIGVKDLECFDSAEYFVVAPPYGDDHPYLIKEKDQYEGRIPCEYVSNANDLELEKIEPESILALANNRLYIDSGTSKLRGLTVYDIESRKVVLQDGYTHGADLETSAEYVRYWLVADERMSEGECSAADFESFGVGLNEYVEYSFATGESKVLEKECVARE